MMPSESLEEDSDGSHQYPHIMYRPYCTHIHTDKVVTSVNQSRGNEDTGLGLGYAQSNNGQARSTDGVASLETLDLFIFRDHIL